MKNVFKLGLVAVAITLTVTSCDLFGGKAAEKRPDSTTIDTTAIDTVVKDTVIHADTAVVADTAAKH